jgi:hypothetical protein
MQNPSSQGSWWDQGREQSVSVSQLQCPGQQPSLVRLQLAKPQQSMSVRTVHPRGQQLSGVRVLQVDDAAHRAQSLSVKEEQRDGQHPS